ncbi:hypothetical protein HK102_010623, partial [Quaeritorhiza haematococci]
MAPPESTFDFDDLPDPAAAPLRPSAPLLTSTSRTMNAQPTPFGEESDERQGDNETDTLLAAFGLSGRIETTVTIPTIPAGDQHQHQTPAVRRIKTSARKDAKEKGGLFAVDDFVGMEDVDLSVAAYSPAPTPGGLKKGTTLRISTDTSSSTSTSTLTNTTTSSSHHHQDKNQTRLLIAIAICFAFFLVELIGGMASRSLALIADSFHLLTDCAAYVVSFAAIWVGRRQATNKFSWGFGRAEVLGALVSVLLIWVLTAFLVMEALERLQNPNEPINGKAMLFLAFIGLLVNIGLLYVLGLDHDHHHHHDHHHDHHDDEHAHPHAHGGKDMESGQGRGKVNINVQAAILHAVGDLLCSIGVVISSIVVIIKPEWQFVDPLCTFLFSFIVLLTTSKIMRDIILVLMEGTPSHVNTTDIQSSILSLPNVSSIHEFHVWGVSMDKLVMSVHVVVDDGVVED